MNIKNLFKRQVDIFEVEYILRQFVKECKINMIIHFEVTRTGLVKLYTNKPGLIIGRAGKDINMLTKKFKEECNVKDVRLYEMKNLVSNCGIY